MKPASPPRLAQRLLRALLPAESRDEVMSDLHEIWLEKRETPGPSGSDRWYWGQVRKAIRPSMQRVMDTARPTRREGVGQGTLAILFQDLRYAATQLRRHPGVGVIVVLTLSLGIGATTAIFSVVHAVLLTPLPYDAPSELVTVTTRVGDSQLPRFVSGPDVVDMIGESGVNGLTEVGGFLEATTGPMTRVERPEHVLTTPVTWNVFRTLGVDVALGRGFNQDDAVPAPQDATNPPPVSAIISHAFWQRSFGEDPGVIGTVVYIWGGATEIVGVLPEGFQLTVPPELNIPPDGDIWRAMRWDMSTWARDWPSMRVIGRLAGGTTVNRVQPELDLFAAHLRNTHPVHEAENIRFRLAPLQSAVAAPLQGPLWLLMGAVTLVLFIACANVANLLLARGASRASEMAVRSSLGAGGRRLVRQLLTESGLMAVLGAAGGIVLAKVGLNLLHLIRPDELHRLGAVKLDVPVLAFTVVVAAAATMLSGLWPAYQTARSGLSDNLGSRGGIRAGRRSREFLVISEVALSVVLLVGAGLLIRTFSELQRMPLGFEPEQVLTVTATQSSRPREERQAYEAELIRAVQSVPGVTTSGIVFPLPMNGVYDRSAEYAMEGRQTDPTGWVPAYFRTVSPTYFDAMGLELKSGRPFVTADENYDLPIVILDERLAAREFQGRDPVGEALWVRGMEGDTLRAQIVGIVEYAPQWDHRDTRPTMYFPRVFYQSHEVSLVAKVAGSASLVAPQLSAAIRSVDPGFPADLVPMQDFVEERLAQSRFLLILMQIFGALALGLSAIGLYGVLAYSVRQRTRELGVRMALGAQASQVTRSVVANGFRLAMFGVGIGLLGSLVMGRLLRAQLFQVGAADPWALTGAALLVLSVALLSSLVPASRAARVSPATALQSD
jgi:putative ABC transport system permease protein